MMQVKKEQEAKKHEETTKQAGMISVLPDEAAAREAWQELAAHSKSPGDSRFVKTIEDLEPMVLTPIKPLVPRNRRILYGVIVGAVLGAVAALVVDATAPQWPWPPYVAVLIGVMLGVLWGSTVGGLGAPPYREDTMEELKHHLKEGKVLLLTLADKQEQQRLQRVVSRFRPVETITFTLGKGLASAPSQTSRRE